MEENNSPKGSHDSDYRINSPEGVPDSTNKKGELEVFDQAYDKETFKSLLDQTYLWPAEYPFKFIVSPEKVDELKGLLNNAEVLLRPSKTGKYVSVSTEMKMASSDEVIYIYEKVKNIEGIISL